MATLLAMKECLSRALGDLHERVEGMQGLPIDDLDKKQEAFERSVQKMREEVARAVQTIKDAINAREREMLAKIEQLAEENNLCDVVSKLQDIDAATSLLAEGQLAAVAADAEANVDELASITSKITEAIAEIDDAGSRVMGLLCEDVEMKFTSDSSALAQAISAFVSIESKVKCHCPRVAVEEAYLDKVRLSWDNSLLSGPCQVIMKNTLNGHQTIVHSGTDSGCVVGDLDPGTTYMFCLKTNSVLPWCNWKHAPVVEVKPLPPPQDFRGNGISGKEIMLSWSAMEGALSYHVEMRGPSDSGFAEFYSGGDAQAVKDNLEPGTEYAFRIRAEYNNGRNGTWSDEVKVKTLSWENFSWRACPEHVKANLRYSVDPEHPKVVTKVGTSDYCTAVGEMPLFENKRVSWSIRIQRSSTNNGNGILVGIAPRDVNQNNGFNFKECGWYLNCLDSTLCSGPPHSYKYKEYGPRVGTGKYVHTGSTVSVVVDMLRGDISYVLNDVDLGVAYEGIPLDRPLVPCVLLMFSGDSALFDPSEVSEQRISATVPVPDSLSATSSAWNSMCLSWGAVAGASFYQVEAGESKLFGTTTVNRLVKSRLLPETEYRFRVRAVKEGEVGEWSAPFGGRTQSPPQFSECVWAECPRYVDQKLRYSVSDTSQRGASRLNDYYGFSTVVGSTVVPSGKATTWNVKVLNSQNNNGANIYIGVAPSDIDQNDSSNHSRCGWYFHCYDSALCSGPPHNYRGKAYGPRKKFEECAHKGNIVSVTMDTENGELSFALNGMNLGVAYEGVPLDKPLVPCALLFNKGDTVELTVAQAQAKSFLANIFSKPW